MVKIYKSLLLALCFCAILIFTAKPASAYVIDWVYTWYSTSGTYAYNAFTPLDYWVSGDISGTPLAKIEEKYTSETGEFMYDVSNVRPDHDTYGIMQWELYNPYGIIASSVLNGPPSTAWTVTTSSDKWSWSTPHFSEGADGVGIVGNFGVYTSAPRGLVTGTVYFANSSGTPPASNPTASGKVSGPVPEPASLLLLGSGLLGVALVGVRKRKI